MRMTVEHPLHVFLASQSPRRRELLARLGITPDEVRPSEFDEASVPHSGTAQQLVEGIALGKVRTVVDALSPAEHATTVVIGGDLLTFLDSTPFGKPTSRDEARTVIQRFMGVTHLEVGTCVVWSQRYGYTSHTDEAWLTLPTLTGTALENYLDIADPTDKAGGISAREWHAVDRAHGGAGIQVEGDFSTIIGLNLATAARLLHHHGISVPQDPQTAERAFTQEFLT